MYILSIDPGGIGGHTGIALGEYTDTEPYRLVYHEHVPDDLVGFVQWLKDHVVAGEPPMVQFNGHWYPAGEVLMEDFEDFGIRGADWTPLKLIGAAAYVFGDALTMRRPIDRKIVSDDTMKLLGAYVPGGHHRDATEASRHAVAYLLKNRHLPTIEKGWPNAERF